MRILATLLALTPASALACPSCATRERPGVLGYVVLGLMIAAPYAIALVAFRVIRRLERRP